MPDENTAPQHRATAVVAGAGIRVRGALPDEVIDLRHRVLRAGLPRDSAIFPGDDAPTTRHFAATRPRGAGGRAEEIIGVATLVLNEWGGRPAWQLRGMAV